MEPLKIPGGLLFHGHVLDALAELPDGVISCVVTSPPYWGPRNYDAPDAIWPDGWDGQFGREPTPQLYVEHTMMILRELGRVLRDDGVVWWNIGDTYVNDAKWGESTGGKHAKALHGKTGIGREKRHTGLKPKSLVLMPERISIAAQDDGWIIRKRVIWHKPNVKPESVQDRPTVDYEHIYMLTKKPKYWYDRTAVLEEAVKGAAGSTFTNGKTGEMGLGRVSQRPREDNKNQRNLRSVWSFPTGQYKGAHYAVFPTSIPERCILASCPPEICSLCDMPRVRIVDRKAMVIARSKRGRELQDQGRHDASNGTMVSPAVVTTVGWTDCGCEEPNYQPGIVLDPFFGTGSTGLAAHNLGRHIIGIEISDTYIELAQERLSST